MALAQLGKDVIASNQCKLRFSLVENIPVHLMQSLPFSWSSYLWAVVVSIYLGPDECLIAVHCKANMTGENRSTGLR